MFSTIVYSPEEQVEYLSQWGIREWQELFAVPILWEFKNEEQTVLKCNVHNVYVRINSGTIYHAYTQYPNKWWKKWWTKPIFHVTVLSLNRILLNSNNTVDSITCKEHAIRNFVKEEASVLAESLWLRQLESIDVDNIKLLVY